jgi:hypothetical protein
MAKKKAPQPQPDPIETPQPAPEAVEKFSALMAEEARRTPAPPRELEPCDVARLVRSELVLPAGATLEFKTSLLRFRVPPDEERDYAVDAVVTAHDRAAAEAALDAAIRAAEPGKTQSHGEARFFLHAVQYPERRSARIPLRYIFRQRPSEASAERR